MSESSNKGRTKEGDRHEGIDSNPTKKDDRVGVHGTHSDYDLFTARIPTMICTHSDYDLFTARIQSGYARAEGQLAASHSS
jgi:hypothetical protein